MGSRCGHLSSCLASRLGEPDGAGLIQSFVIPGLSAFLRAEPGSYLSALAIEKQIPGSLADEAGEGPGMTV
jgi:hypothetical protein